MITLIVLQEENEYLLPILKDFGKCTHASKARKYRLTQKEKVECAKNHPHISPDLISGENCPSFSSEIYRFGRIFRDTVMFTGKSFDECITNLYRNCLNEESFKRPTINAVIDVLQ